MSLKTVVNKNDDGKYTISITVLADYMNKIFDDSYKKVSSNIVLPGFRKGKAPKQLLKTKVEPYVKKEVMEYIFQDVFNEALQKEGLAGISEPTLVERDDMLDSLSEDKDFYFEVTLDNAPYCDLAEYKGLKINFTEYEYDDNNVNEVIESKRKDLATVKDKEDDEEVNYGDTVSFQYCYCLLSPQDMEKKLESVKVTKDEGEKPINYELGDMRHEFVGMKRNDEKMIPLTIPDNVENKDIAGKEGNLYIRIIGIECEMLPEVDDEFAKDLEYENLDDMKKDISEKLDETCKEREKQEKIKNIIDRIIMDAEYNIPEETLNFEKSKRLNNFAYGLNQYQIKLDTFLESQNISKDDFEKNLEEDSVAEIKKMLALNKIFNLENLGVSEDDIEKKIDEIVESREPNTRKKVRKVFKNPDQREAVKNMLENDKLIDYLLENNEFTPTGKEKLKKEEETSE